MYFRNRVLNIASILCIIQHGNICTYSKELEPSSDKDETETGVREPIRNVVFYNRVAKAGSGTLIHILDLLSKENGFELRKERNNRMDGIGREDIMLDYDTQIGLNRLLSSFTSPTVFYKHTGFVDFQGLDSPMPIYINLVRDPIQRVHSYFYYRRSPSTLEYMHKTNPSANLPRSSEEFLVKNFHSCVSDRNPECVYIEGMRRFDMAQLTEFFCGQKLYCSGFNTDVALRKAKYNVEKHYAVVGVLEDFNRTLAVLEHYIPKIFKGSLGVYRKMLKSEHPLPNENKHKHPLDKTTRDILQKNFTREMEFYDFCKQRLHRQYMRMVERSSAKKEL